MSRRPSPRPPARRPPPSSTADTTVSSKPIAAAGKPAPSCEAMISPTSAADEPGDDEQRDHPASLALTIKTVHATGSRPSSATTRPTADRDSTPAISATAPKINVGQRDSRERAGVAERAEPGQFDSQSTRHQEGQPAQQGHRRRTSQRCCSPERPSPAARCPVRSAGRRRRRAGQRRADPPRRRRSQDDPGERRRRPRRRGRPGRS